MVDFDEFSLPDIDQLAKEFGSDVNRGLASSVAATRLEEEGPNELKKPSRRPLLSLFFEQFMNSTALFLTIAALLLVVVNVTNCKKSHHCYGSVLVMLFVAICNVVAGAVARSEADQAVESIAKVVSATVHVIRDSQDQVVKTSALVRGDIVTLNVGDIAPADIRLIDVPIQLRVNEKSFTGEPNEQGKYVDLKNTGSQGGMPKNMVFSTSRVVAGEATGIVVSTGMNTYMGKLTSMFGHIPECVTPFQGKIAKFLYYSICSIGTCLACHAAFVMWVTSGSKEERSDGNPEWLTMINYFVTLAAAALPNGVQMCYSIAFSIRCSSVAAKKMLVRRMLALETFGSVSVICTDKTGTLTYSEYAVARAWTGGVHYDVSGKGYDPTVGEFKRSDTGTNGNKDVGVVSLLMAGMLCSNGTAIQEVDLKTQELHWVAKGNLTDVPIVVAAQKVGLSLDSVQSSYKRVLEIPFTSTNKIHATITEVAGRSTLCSGGIALPVGTAFMTVVKGAPERILRGCTTWITETGDVLPLTAVVREDIEKVQEDYGSLGRVIGLAIRPLAEMPWASTPNKSNIDMANDLLDGGFDLQFAGLFLYRDDIRDGSKEFVEWAHGTGIRVVMLTGDHHTTGQVIARSVGILNNEDDGVVECPGDFPDDLLNDELDEITATKSCFSRTSLHDKLRVVDSLRRQGHVCAMIGDGDNDAAALHQADVGIAMGINGAETAKESSDVVLVNDDFSSLVSALEKGYSIFASVQKFVAFLISVRIAEVLQFFICNCKSIPMMWTPFQLMLLVALTELPISIAFGMNPGDLCTRTMRSSPRKRPIDLWWRMPSALVNGLILAFVSIALYRHALLHYCDGLSLEKDVLQSENSSDKIAMARTVAFISLVCSVNCRAYSICSSTRPFWEEHVGHSEMLKAILVSHIGLGIFVLMPVFSDKVLGLCGLKIGLWGWAVSCIGPLSITIFGEVFKLFTNDGQQTCWGKKPGNASMASRVQAAALALLARSVRQFRPSYTVHSGHVLGAALAPNKELLMTVSSDGTCRLWGPQAVGPWGCLQVLESHKSSVQGVVFAPFSDLLVTVGDDMTCRVWGLQAHEEYVLLQILTGHTAGLCGAAFTQDGKLLATASRDKTCRLWTCHASGEWVCQQVLSRHRAPVRCVRFGQGCGMLLTCSDDSTSQLWTKEKESDQWIYAQELSGHEDKVCGAAITESEDLIVTVSEDSYCLLWTTKDRTWRCTQCLSGHREGVHAAAFAPGGELLATVSGDHTCHLWARESIDAVTWINVQILAGHTDELWTVSFLRGSAASDPRELQFCTASSDQTAIVWRYTRGDADWCSHGTAYKACHIRPATDSEMAFPIVNMLVTFAQKLALALSPTLLWNPSAIAPVAVPLRVPMLSVQIFPSLEHEFFVKTCMLLAALAAFLCCASEGRGVLIVRVMSVFAVAPAVKQLAHVFACDHDGVLLAAPTVHCFEGAHLYCAVAALVLGLPYILLLIPFTAAEGDLVVMPRRVWLQPAEWIRRKNDKAHGIDLGILNPARHGILWSAYAELVAKIMLPTINIFFVSHPGLHAGYSMLVAMVPWVIAFRFPPYADRNFNMAVHLTHLLGVHAYFASCISVFNADESTLLPALVLYSGFAGYTSAFLAWKCHDAKTQSRIMLTEPLIQK